MVGLHAASARLLEAKLTTEVWWTQLTNGGDQPTEALATVAILVKWEVWQ